MEKMTYFTALEFVLTNCDMPAEVRDKLTAMKMQVQKKNAAERKPTATQSANEGYKRAILARMQDGRAYTITDLLQEIPAISTLSNQRVSAIVRQMKDEGAIVREEVKRKAYFTKVECINE